MLRVGNPILFPLSPSSDCPCGFQGGETTRRKTTYAFSPIRARKQKANHVADLCMLKQGANPRRRGRRGCPPGASRDGEDQGTAASRPASGTFQTSPDQPAAQELQAPPLADPGHPFLPDWTPVRRGSAPGSCAPLRGTPSSRRPARARGDILPNGDTPQNDDTAGSGTGVRGAPRVQSSGTGGTSVAVGCCPFPLPL